MISIEDHGTALEDNSKHPIKPQGGRVMLPKLTMAILFVSLNLAVASPDKSLKNASMGTTTTHSEMKVDLDSIFIDLQSEFDEIINSPVVKSKTATSVNGYFFKKLKNNQLFYSFTKVNSKGVLTNEVIRMVENFNVKPVNLSKEFWVKRTIISRKPYTGLKKLEQTGRYYLLWAAPVFSKDKKGKETLVGAVSLKIDLWDCFHKYANKSETPFLIRMGKMKLYSNKWKTGTRYKEELLTIAGINRISVRYPKVLVTETAAPVVSPEPVKKDTIPAVDSAAIKKAQLDSVKAIKAVQEKKKAQRINLIVAAVIALLIFSAAFIFIIVPVLKHRRMIKDIEKSDGDDKWRL